MSAVDTEKTDSPLVRASWPVGLRYRSLIPRIFARPWPTLVAVPGDILLPQESAREEEAMNAMKVDEGDPRLAMEKQQTGGRG